MTDFTEFIYSLPQWDGKDRVSELQRLVSIKTGIYIFKDYHFILGDWVTMSILKVCDGGEGLIFQGTQGIGKSTLIRWLFPFRQEVSSREGVEIATTASGTKLIETEDVSILPVDTIGLPILYLEYIDYSYTSIDVKQLYAQVLAK